MKKETKKLLEELQNIEDSMDATQIGDGDTLMMLGLGDDWDELSEMRTKKVEEIIMELKKESTQIKEEANK